VCIYRYDIAANKIRPEMRDREYKDSHHGKYPQGGWGLDLADQGSFDYIYALATTVRHNLASNGSPNAFTRLKENIEGRWLRKAFSFIKKQQNTFIDPMKYQAQQAGKAFSKVDKYIRALTPFAPPAPTPGRNSYSPHSPEYYHPIGDSVVSDDSPPYIAAQGQVKLNERSPHETRGMCLQCLLFERPNQMHLWNRAGHEKIC
jgi:hypothetical protein